MLFVWREVLQCGAGCGKGLAAGFGNESRRASRPLSSPPILTRSEGVCVVAAVAAVAALDARCPMRARTMLVLAIIMGCVPRGLGMLARLAFSFSAERGSTDPSGRWAN